MGDVDQYNWKGVYDCQGKGPKKKVQFYSDFFAESCIRIQNPSCEHPVYDVQIGVSYSLSFLKKYLGQTQGFSVSDGVDVTGYVRYTDTGCNAFAVVSAYDSLFDEAQLVFQRCGSDDLVPLDVVAHELMHIVTEFAVSLRILPDIDGALDEGFSDIFGTVMEWEISSKKNGDLPDFLICNEHPDCTNSVGGAFRNNEDPSKTGGIESICDYSKSKSKYDNLGVLTRAFVKTVRACTSKCRFPNTYACVRLVGSLFLYVDIFHVWFGSDFLDIAEFTCSKLKKFYAMKPDRAVVCTEDELLSSLEEGWSKVDIKYTGDVKLGQCDVEKDCGCCRRRRALAGRSLQSCAIPGSRELETCPVPPPIPPNGPGRTSGVFGDPHLSTFDRLRFDCQAFGEFIMVKATNGLSDFMIQERFTSATDSSVCTQASVSTGIVIRDDGVPTVQVSMVRSGNTTGATELGSCHVDLYVDRKLVPFGSDLGTQEIEISHSTSAITIRYPYTGVRVSLAIRSSGTFGCFFTVRVFLPLSYDNAVVGLYGKPNGSRGDDWVDSTGGSLYGFPNTDEASLFGPAYEYCTSQWCIRDPLESLFTYREDESFQAISGCDEDYSEDLKNRIDAEIANNNTDLLAKYGTDNLRCLIDGICGNLNDALVVLADEAEILEAQEQGAPLPSAQPSASPSSSASPSLAPSKIPSDNPSQSLQPSAEPSLPPTKRPSAVPSLSPSVPPSELPRLAPTSRSKSGKDKNIYSMKRGRRN